MRFTGKVVLVAGGTGGLGRVVSLSFLEEGAKVIVTYREQKEFDAIKTEAGANGSAIEGHHTDVTDETAVRQLLDKVLAEQGRLDAQRLQIAAFIALAEAIPNDAARLHDAYLVLLQQITTAPAPAEAAPLQIEQSHVEAERWIEPPAPSLGQQP